MVAAEPTTELVPRWLRFVAVGDSFTEGLWDPYPTTSPDPANHSRGDQVLRGWADRLAETLSARRLAAGAAPLEYANLAIRGRLLPAIINDQLPDALAARADLVSLIGGGNDILRPGADVDTISQVLEDAVTVIRDTGADVLLGAGFKGTGTMAFTRAKMGALNANIWSIAHRTGAYVLDLWGMRCLTDPRMGAPDRIHLTPEGHRRVANAALHALHLEPDDPGYDAPPAPAPALSRVARARADMVWAREHALPWVRRRLTHTSTGDGRPAKQPHPVPWPTPDRYQGLGRGLPDSAEV